MVYLMAKELRYGKMAKNMKENLCKEWWMEQVYGSWIVKNTLDNLKMIRKMEEDFINGLMVRHMMENGKMEKEMEKEFINGQVEKHMTENGNTIREMEKEF